DHLLVIGRGKLIADCTVGEFIARNSVQAVRVRTPQPETLVKVVTAAGGGAARAPRPPGPGAGCPLERGPDMATATHLAPQSRPAALPAPAGRAGFGGALRSEFTKIRSVRSTYWTLLALVIVTVGIGTL